MATATRTYRSACARALHRSLLLASALLATAGCLFLCRLPA